LLVGAGTRIAMDNCCEGFGYVVKIERVRLTFITETRGISAEYLGILAV
jgi:hypothetical protein